MASEVEVESSEKVGNNFLKKHKHWNLLKVACFILPLVLIIYLEINTAKLKSCVSKKI